MRILQLVDSLRRGGAERILLELSLGFKDLDHKAFVIGLLNVNEFQEKPYGLIPFDSLMPPSIIDGHIVYPYLPED